MSWWEWVFSGIGVSLPQWLTRKKKALSASVSVQGGMIDRSIVATAGSKVEYHQYNYPAAVGSSPGTKPLPNFAYVCPQSKFVFISDRPVEGIREPHNQDEKQQAVYALILKFTNEAVPGGKIGKAMDVIATIKFRSEDRRTEQRIDYGVWLDSSCASTDFEAGDTRELLLVIDAHDQSLRTLEDKRTNINYPEQFDYLRAAIVTDMLDSVEVVLTDQRSQAIFRRAFKVWMHGANFNVAEITT